MASACDQLTRLLSLIPWLRGPPGGDQGRGGSGPSRSRPTSSRRDLRAGRLREVRAATRLPASTSTIWDDEITVIDAQSVDRPLRLRVDEAVTLLVGLRALAASPASPTGTSSTAPSPRSRRPIGVSAADRSPTPGPSGRRSPDAVVAAVQDALTPGPARCT